MTLTVAGQPLIAFLLASIRILAWLAVVPPFSGRTVPPMAKLVLSLGLAFAVAPAGDAIPLDTVGLLFNVGTQVLVGLAMGFVTQLMLAAIAAAGSLIDVFGGFSLAAGLRPALDEPEHRLRQAPPDARDRAAVRQRRAPAGHRRAAAHLPLPPARDHPDWSGAPDLLIKAFSLFFVTAVQIALPMIAVLFLADLGLALLTKVAPQLNAINVMFPAKIGLTLLLIGLSFPVLPQALSRLVELATQAMATLSGAG